MFDRTFDRGKAGACRHRSRRSGFTLVELITILILVGALAVAALPMLNNSTTYRGASFRDEAVAALRYGQKSAVSHLRLVCASFTATTVSLRIAASNDPAVPTLDCTANLNGPDGAAAYAQSLDTSNVAFLPLPATIYFQPSGIATSDAAGTTVTTANIAFKDSSTTSISIVGATGYIN